MWCCLLQYTSFGTYVSNKEIEKIKWKITTANISSDVRCFVAVTVIGINFICVIRTLADCLLSGGRHYRFDRASASSCILTYTLARFDAFLILLGAHSHSQACNVYFIYLFIRCTQKRLTVAVWLRFLCKSNCLVDKSRMNEIERGRTKQIELRTQQRQSYYEQHYYHTHTHTHNNRLVTVCEVACSPPQDDGDVEPTNKTCNQNVAPISFLVFFFHHFFLL